MSARFPRTWASAVLALVMLSAGCDGSPGELTQVTFFIDAESDVAATTRALHVRVRAARTGTDDFQPVYEDTLARGDDIRWPLDLALVPTGDGRRRFEVTATARDESGDELAQARVRSGYVDGKVLALTLLLENACLGISCNGSSTCTGGACVSAEVRAETFDELDPERPRRAPPPVRYPDAGPVDAGMDADGMTPDAGPDGQVDAGPDAGDGSEPETCAADTCDNGGSCDDSTGTVVCTCPEPFDGPRCTECLSGLKRQGSTCVWDAVVTDPSFDDPGSWTVTGEAAVASSRAELTADTACLGGSVVTRVNLPPVAYTGRLKLVLSTRRTSGSSPALAVSLDGNIVDFGIPNAGTYQDRTLCVDPSLHGRELELRLVPTYSGCSFSSDVHVDSIRFAPATMEECPVEAFVPNGDFESGAVRWTVNGEAGSGVGLDGINGSKGARLTAENGTPKTLTGEIYVPLASEVARPALHVWHDADADSLWNVAIDNEPIGAYLGSGAQAEELFCIPPWLAGRHWPLRVSLLTAFSGGNLDDVEVVHEPECNWDETGLVGGGFELFTNAQLSRPFFAGDEFRERPIEELVVTGSATALAGDRAVRTTIGSCRSSQSITFSGSVPRAEGTSGPALRFGYRSTNFAGVAFCTVQTRDRSGISETLDPSTAWQTVTACVDPSLQGRAVRMGIRFSLMSSSCPGDDPEHDLWIDEVKMVTDSSCPAQ